MDPLVERPFTIPPYPIFVAALPVGFLALAGPVRAQEQPPEAQPAAEESAPKPRPDKSGFNLVDRTPDDLLRPLSTDRPDTTDTPITVDAGHVQLEMDFLSYTYDRVRADRKRIRTDSYVVGHENLKVGITNDVDLELDWVSYELEREHDFDSGERTRHEGFGDLIWRVKVNVHGNEGGPWALAIMPFIKIPTAHDGLGNGTVEGGIIFPIAIAMPAGFDLGFTFDVDFDNGADRKYFLDFVGSTSLGYTILERLRFYLELWGAVNTEASSPPLARVDVGFSFQFTPNVQLDGGVNVGLTPATDDLNSFIGISIRY
jgi:hypothetical protein